LLVFQRDLMLSSSIEDQARAGFWIGKMEQRLGDSKAAQSAWRQAASLDTTGYYSLRSADMLSNRPAFEASKTLNLNVDSVPVNNRSYNMIFCV
jgi:hypothetical protein